jgi:hypothetical protein
MVDRMRTEAHVGRQHKSRPVGAALGFDASKQPDFESAKRTRRSK